MKFKVFITLLLFFVMQPRAYSGEYDFNKILENFYNIMFYDELTGENVGYVRKWMHTIYPFIAGANKREIEFSNNYFSHINDIGYVNFSNTNDEDNYNYFVFFIDEYRMKDVIENIMDNNSDTESLMDVYDRLDINNERKCFGIIFENHGIIFKSIIFIDRNLGNLELNSCIEEEFSQSLGLLNDIYPGETTIFSDDNIYSSLTNFDHIYMSLLYLTDINAGDSAEDAMGIVREEVFGIVELVEGRNGQ